MKALTLLLLRMSTGALLIIWGLIKLMAPQAAIGVSNKYYFGLLSADDFQVPLGAAEVALGLAVVLGLFRAVVYPLQALVLGTGLAAIWKYIADPFGMYLLTEETRQILFFPSTAVFAASLVILAFREYDTITLDRTIGGG
jgi:putative oxidoreductase